MNLDFTGVGSVAELAKSVVERIWPERATEAERARAQIAIQEMLEKREAQILSAQRDVMVAELTQGDAYTKRARPTIVYMGLCFIGLVHVVLPVAAWAVLTATAKPLAAMPDISLPGEFWAAWGGVCSVWVLGRTLEKRGAGGAVGKAAALVTGGRFHD
ncbi:MAG: hypothetical protein JRI97_05970 [Deltaproteobacteria bacterium]|nr:hypothetical protein [Deltaproteobacteria bacterium]